MHTGTCVAVLAAALPDGLERFARLRLWNSCARLSHLALPSQTKESKRRLTPVRHG
jgi:hypothetical protein